MVGKTHTGISLNSKILAELDEERGLIPRSRFLQKILEERYHSNKGIVVHKGGNIDE
jgi:metal-responsive CopG/Arc/MetJ family transcriptional regulator